MKNNILGFSVKGITCDACLRLITILVTEIKGVEDFQIDKSGSARIVAARKIMLSEVTEVLKDTEYTVI